MQITFACEHERVVLRRRLLLEDVERRAADLPRFERLEQRGLVDDAAARGVHDPHAGLHLREARGAEQPGRVLRLRHVHA